MANPRSHPSRSVLATATFVLAMGCHHALAQTPPDDGEALAGQCQACHTVDKDAGNMIGPNLYGVFGSVAGSAPDFSYSPAIKASKIVWSDKTLDIFLTDPASMVPGTKMGFPGIADPAQRAAVIAYLKKATAKP